MSAADADPTSPEGAKRIVAIVLDDLNMSFASMAYTRQALLKLIDTQIEPGDRVAVIRVDQEGMRTEWFTERQARAPREGQRASLQRDELEQSA